MTEPGPLAGITEAHSEIRRRVGLGPVSWDPDIAAYAQEWADELQRRDCALEHRPRQGRFAQRYGENLFWQSGGTVRAADVVNDWASEEANYNLERNRCRGVCGHYTQIVWKETTRIGCAMASCGAAEVWVCNYDPPGNVNGRRPY